MLNPDISCMENSVDPGHHNAHAMPKLWPEGNLTSHDGKACNFKFQIKLMILS